MRAEQVSQVVRALKTRSYRPNEYIFKQGDKSDMFYLIKSGSIEVSINLPPSPPSEQPTKKVLRTLLRWDYLGERGLLLNQETFKNIVGNFQKALEQRIKLQDSDITMKD